jgi:hypothetical protein
MSNRLWGFALVAVTLLLGTLGAADPAVAGDGSVRFLTAGPVRLGDGHIAHMRVFLPAVQRPVHVHFLGEGGEVLKSVEVDPSDPSKPFHEIFFEASFEGPGTGRFPVLSIKDGTSNTIFTQVNSNGIIAILIGLRGPGRGGMGTMQVVDAAGTPVFLLPYIEQDNLFRR